MDRVWNEEVRRRAVIKRELVSRMDQRVWRWFWHEEGMDEYRLARRALYRLAKSKRRASTR